MQNPEYRGQLGFPSGSVGKEPACNADQGSIPGSGRSPGEGNGNPLQYSCLENSNPMNRRTWWAIVHGVTRVRHNVVTKPPLCLLLLITFYPGITFFFFFKNGTLHKFACHPCAGAMLIFSVLFQF